MKMRPIAMGAILVAVITVTSAQTTSIAQSASVVVEANSPVLRRTQLTEPIGLETLGGVFTPILKAACALPCEVTSTFSTAVDKQTEIKISLFRGSGSLASESYSLGSFAILGIPPLPRGKPLIEVTLRAAGADIILIAKDSAGAQLRIERRDR
jgi:molecular chaperone DnaK (HSP70)